MKRLRIGLAVFLVLSAAALARDSKTHGQTVQIKVHGAALERNHVGDSPDRDVSIYLPPGYESSTQRYPVLYLLHGYTATDRGWMNPNYVGLPEMMDRLIARHAIAPMIVVMPNAFNRFAGSFYANSTLSGGWEDFIVRDLVGYVDAHYRTLAVKASRGIAGHSMGGYGALRIGMDHPEVFGAAYGLSPCCAEWEESEFRDDVVKAQRAKNLQEIVSGGMGPQGALAFAAAFSPDVNNPPFGVDWPFDTKGQPVVAVIDRWKANLLNAIAAKYASSGQGLHALGFDVGRQDELLPSERELDQQMTKLGIAHNFSEYEGTHSSRVGERMEKVALPFMSKNLAAEGGTSAAGAPSKSESPQPR
jgi:enterochelin esterase-like enzyme